MSISGEYRIRIRSDRLELKRIVRILNDNLNNQLFVIFGYKKGTPQKAINVRREKIFKYLTANGLDGSRITFHVTQSRIELIQFWRIPPGAQNPICKECEPSSQVNSFQQYTPKIFTKSYKVKALAYSPKVLLFTIIYLDIAACKLLFFVCFRVGRQVDLWQNHLYFRLTGMNFP